MFMTSTPAWIMMTSNMKIPKAGTNPIKILKHKFYVLLFFKHLDWLLKNLNQSECLNNSHILKIYNC